MSEHFATTGYVNYWHCAIGEEWEMSWCNNCKKNVERMSVEFHQGVVSNWLRIVCCKCKKTMYVVSLNGRLKRIKDDKKCFICKNPTNYYDCYSSEIGGSIKPNKNKYLCSKKCHTKLEKMQEKADDKTK